ncbi:hypothetical protein SAMN05421820_105181 [Pedobacter steynii]|uniref:Oligosaccharide repeat unit polymerase n=1 Tax=Pedobacter steynii TaxID=430522 RepID=A0A1G9WJ45_9SPHI|nr:hypothetical protein [Pedobacter steynii]NQX40305.1 hypothetical protein [Pedobacter steynii]SDM84186.1 hypothetical protein SAMN05421820_105181 [Pedobacter steynii]
MEKLNTQVIKKVSKIDLNTILQWVNAIILMATWYSFSQNGPNKYIDLTTIYLGALLSIQLFAFLKIEKKRRDPFVIVLCFQMVFYYVLRILTLTIYPFSFVFDRFAFTPSDLNKAILFILVANVAIFLGLYLNKVKVSTLPLDNQIKPKRPFVVFMVLLFVYFMVFSTSFGIGPLSIIIGLLNSLFINILIVLFMVAVYIILFYKKFNLQYKILLAGGLLFYIVISTLTGSRAAVISVSYLFLFAYLSIFAAVRIKRIYLALGLIAIPILVVFFTVATFLRPRLENRGAVGGETMEVLKEFDIMEAFEADNEIILAPIFGRIAFLDFAAEIITNKDEYAEVFNFPYYFKSIVDNVLTPGFDVFDTSKTSTALTFIYNNQGKPQKSKVADSYQSDEFTIFGEAYVMFGMWFSILPIFLVAFIFKRVYVRIADESPFLFYVKRSFVLYVFFTLLNSFGLDWLLFDIIGIIFTYLIFKNFFKFQVSNNNIQNV